MTTRWFLVAAVLGLLAPLIGYIMGPFDGSSQNYGANWPSDWRYALASLVAHLAILAIIIAPWRRTLQFRTQRFVLVGALFITIGFAQLILAGHAGRLISWHKLWVIGVGIAACYSAYSANRHAA